VHQDRARPIRNHNGLALLHVLSQQRISCLGWNPRAEYNCLELFRCHIPAFWHKPWVYVDFISRGALSMGGIEKPVSEHAAQ